MAAPSTTNFGRDTSCTNVLRSGRFANGAMLVGEAAYRRLTTPRGMLRGGEDEAHYGLDLLDLIGSIANASDAAALPGMIRNELTKDDRITDVDVDVQRVVNGPVTSYTITIDARTDAGPFKLQLAVSDVTVDLLGITAEAA